MGSYARPLHKSRGIERNFCKAVLRVNRLVNGCLMVCRCHDDTHRCHSYHIAQRDWLLISCADVNE